jgi:RNA polymerase sigma factor (sigma-70 family)
MGKHSERIYFSPDILADKIKRNKATEDEKNLFYELIINLVRKFANKYKLTIKDIEFDDLVHIGFAHLYQSIRTFDSKKARFSTWAWYCLRSAYNREYELYKERSRTRLVGDIQMHNDEFDEATEPLDSAVAIEEDSIQSIFMRDAIRELFQLRVKEQFILREMFGNPFVDEYFLPSKVCISEVASNLGMEYAKVFNFWKKHVKLHLKNKLCEVVTASNT